MSEKLIGSFTITHEVRILLVDGKQKGKQKEGPEAPSLSRPPIFKRAPLKKKN